MKRTRLTSFFALSLCIALMGCGDDGPDPDGDGGVDGGTPAPDYTTGVACTSATDCGANGSGACLEGFELFASTLGETPSDPINWIGIRVPGGYCSNAVDCVTDDECGTGGACYKPIDGASDTSDLHSTAITALDATGVCLQTCSSDSDCRESEGYVCETPLQRELSMVSDRPMDSYCVREQAPPCNVANDVVPEGKCHLEYSLISEFQITDTIGGQGDFTRKIGPGILILEVDRAGGMMDVPAASDGDVTVSCYYNDQRMDVAGVFTAVEQIGIGGAPVPTGTYASATGIIDMTSNCAYDASYGQSTTSWTPLAAATGTSCINDYWSVGDVYCNLGPLCSAGNLQNGHNAQDATWNQPWNNLELENGAGDWSSIIMAGDGAPDLWAPLLACMVPPLDLALSGPPAQDIGGGAVHCEDVSTWVDGAGSPIVTPNGTGGYEVIPGMEHEFECYRLHCIHPVDKVEIPNSTESRTFSNFVGTLEATRCTPTPP